MAEADLVSNLSAMASLVDSELFDGDYAQMMPFPACKMTFDRVAAYLGIFPPSSFRQSVVARHSY